MYSFPKIIEFISFVVVTLVYNSRSYFDEAVNKRIKLRENKVFMYFYSFLLSVGSSTFILALLSNNSLIDLVDLICKLCKK